MPTRVGIITGAASGIGAATAIEFARTGARLVLASLPHPNLEDVVAAAEEAGGEAISANVDVRDPVQLEALPRLAIDRFGQLDFLVANAGVHHTSSIVGGDPERWRALIDTNLLGSMLTVRAVLPTMIDRGSGDIVLMASISGREVYVGAPIYLASKWGLVGFGHALRQEVAQLGIRVTLIEPGMVDTPLTRLDPAIRPLLDAAEPLQPEDVARLVVYACIQPQHVVLSELSIRPQRQPDVVAVGTAATPGEQGGNDSTRSHPR